MARRFGHPLAATRGPPGDAASSTNRVLPVSLRSDGGGSDHAAEVRAASVSR